MKAIKFILALFALSLLCSFAFFPGDKPVSPVSSGEETKIQWHSFKEAVELSKKEKKKIFIDVYTSWCGWCKVMEKNTFTNPVIAKYINDKFYAVRLDAEMKDTVVFDNHVFVNPNPAVPRSTHELASSLLGNRLSYPTTVYLDENFNLLTQVPGYLQPNQLEPILKYFGENAYPKMKWEDYQQSFKSEITGTPPPAEAPVH